MERRQFIILTAAGTAGSLTLEACSSHTEYTEPLYVVNEKYIPGADYWHATICGQCQAGCGVIVRQRDGNANKIEGNPLHPISQGKLCARGQAGLNELYNPDRIKGPLKLNGARGSGKFQEITWDNAIETLASRLNDLRSRGEARQIGWIEGSESRGSLRDLTQRFLSALGAPGLMLFRPFSREVEQESARTLFGTSALPTYDLSQADFVLSFGARFLETWSSPVYYSRGFGAMRRGRKTRGRFVHAEPRLSLTAANADEWLPVRPGAEGRLALSIAHELAAISGRSLSFSPSDSFDPQVVQESTGISAATVRRIAKELAESERIVVLGGDAAAAHTSGSFNLAAINYLASIVNGAADARYVIRSEAEKEVAPLTADLLREAQLVMVHGANPVFNAPAASGVAEALAKVPFIVSFSSFEDETTALADLVLPDHTAFERWDDNLPLEGITGQVVSFAQPVVAPLYQTRQTGDVLLSLAAKIPEIASGFKAESFKAVIEQRHFNAKSESEVGSDLQRGGIWPDEQPKATAPQQPRGSATIGAEEQAQFAGDEHEYPFHFLPYEHLALGVGETANQPLLQSLPDPLTAVSWGSWIEINPETAVRYGINQGDLLAVESPNGRIEAPAVVYPGIRPDVVAMPCGQGHERYGRYASNRGVNPLRILAPMKESKTGALAWAATRVRVTKLNGKSGMVTSGTNERLLEDRRDLKR